MTSFVNSTKRGSSPRVWGTLGRLIVSDFQKRFIPTGVGNASEVASLTMRAPVHPHGCGERRRADGRKLIISGSSPRVWGTRFQRRIGFRRYRFIPTGVGNAKSRLCSVDDKPVHPHGCGERFYFVGTVKNLCGSSPRVWGTRKYRSC